MNLREFLDRLLRRKPKPTPPLPKPPEPTPEPVPPDNSWYHLLELHNSVRSNPLRISKDLMDKAQIHVETMSKLKKLYHSNIGVLMTDHGAVGENIAQGQTSVDQVFGDWMSSSGHKANIKSRSYNVVGFGRSGSGSNTFWCTIFGAK